MKAKRLLFVCLGNICRSPLAEGIFLHLAEKRGVADHFEVDSAGTGSWHVGERPDHRAAAVAKRYKVMLPSIGRQVDPSRDYVFFDLLLVMDLANLGELRRLGAPEEKVRLLRSFDPELAGVPEAQLAVPDPYFGDGDGFDQVYEMLARACDGLLDELLE
jgi:protein-tyrosine phosphatase